MTAPTLAFAIFCCSFVLAVSLTPLVRRLALRWGVVDQPGNRKIHTKPMPCMGGVAIFLAWLLPLALLWLFGDAQWARLFGDRHTMLWLMLSATGMVVLGLYDDIRGATAGFKLPIEIAAAISLYLAGFRIETVSNPFGSPVVLGVFALPVTVVWVVGLTNAVNLMDGVDGLAAGVAALTAVVLGLAERFAGQSAGILYAVPIAGAALGFLVHNFPPATIFMGDCGSLFLGFTLATLSLVSSQKGNVALAVFVPLLVFGVPLTDTFLAVVRRYLTGRQLFEADRRHVHHMLLLKGLSPRRVVLVLYGTTALFGGGALVLVNMSGNWAVLVLIAVGAGIVAACKMLGYDEFRHIRDLLANGLHHRPRAVFCRELTKSVGERILTEHSFDRVWDLVKEVGNILEFDRITFEPTKGVAATASSPPQGADAASAGVALGGAVGEGCEDIGSNTALPPDFRRRSWCRPHVETARSPQRAVELSVRVNGRAYGRLVFERMASGRKSVANEAVLADLSQYVSTRMVTLEQEIAKRAN